MATKTVGEVVTMNNNFPFGMFVAGVVLTIAASVECDDNDCEGDGEALAVALGVINTVLVIVYMAMLFQRCISDTVDLILCITLFVLWAFTAGFLTFEGPFLIPGNGYVAAWLGVLAALGNLVFSSKFADSMKTRAQQQSLPLLAMMGGSVVVIFAAFSNGCCDGQEILAIIAGVVGLIVGIIRLIIGGAQDKIIGGFLVVWWLALGVFLTFSLFREIGNGYLGCWVAIIASCIIASQAK